MPDPVTLDLLKAGPIHGREVPDLFVNIEVEFPEHQSLDAQRLMHRSNGRRLGEALVKSLPGGTIDQLLVYLLEHQASLYTVAHQPKEK